MLGISVYPHKSTTQEIKNYLMLANKYGYKRVFSCLISSGDTKKSIEKDFKEWIQYANELDMEVVLDIAPSVIKNLKIDIQDQNALKFFKDLGVFGLRLDIGFDGITESILTQNPFDIKIEINASMNTSYINNIFDFKCNKNNIQACHNFFPQEFTGLSRKHFDACNVNLKNLGVKNAAFISSKSGKFSPWDLTNGLPTLEEHRNIPVTSQAKDLIYDDKVDLILFANAFATEQELQEVALLDKNSVIFDIKIISKETKLIKSLLFNYPSHYRRGDINEFTIRSTQSRVDFSKKTNPANNTPTILYPGDVVILNDNAGRYKNEVHIVIKKHKNINRSKNLVAKVKKYDLILLKKVEPWKRFGFTKK